MTPKDATTIAAFGVVGAIAIVPIIMLANSLSVFLLWGWFAVPLLDADPIGIFGAFGLALLVGALVGPLPDKAKESGVAAAIGQALLRPVVAIAFGWAAHFFI